jgi:DNA ligase-1
MRYLATLFGGEGASGGAGGGAGSADKETLPYLDFVETVVCNERKDVMKFHEQYVAKGYEGVMLRNSDSVYCNKRTYDLQKVKTFLDDEFTIVGFEKGSGVEEGCIVWVCETEDKNRFSCRPQGTHDERKDLYLHGDEYIGKKLTVKYQELSEDGIPRFPVGLRVRDD